MKFAWMNFPAISLAHDWKNEIAKNWMNFPNIGLTISKISKSQDFQDLSLGIENFNPKISKFHLLLTPIRESWKKSKSRDLSKRHSWKKIQPKFQKSLFGKWVSVISGKKSRLKKRFGFFFQDSRIGVKTWFIFKLFELEKFQIFLKNFSK